MTSARAILAQRGGGGESLFATTKDQTRVLGSQQRSCRGVLNLLELIFFPFMSFHCVSMSGAGSIVFGFMRGGGGCLRALSFIVVVVAS